MDKKFNLYEDQVIYFTQIIISKISGFRPPFLDWYSFSLLNFNDILILIYNLYIEYNSIPLPILFMDVNNLLSTEYEKLSLFFGSLRTEKS